EAHDGGRLAGCSLEDLAPLSPWLDAEERGALVERLRAIDGAGDGGGGGP
ncbi:MAG: hypothetical protein JOZ69_04760, partial [Myxococcales bacterium]|nr:hypothetical protein [Myxococcales bacterium]